VKSQRFLLTVLAGALGLALAPAVAAAQRGGRPAHGGGSRSVVVRPAYGPHDYGYHGYYDPFFWGYSGWYPYGFYAPFYPGVYGRPAGSARIQVTPKQAEVYVDGYLAGTVDDFDGFLQRLDVPAGEHELTLYLPGYRTIRQQVLFRPGATVKISYAMEPLGQGAADEPRPRPNPDVAPPEPEAARPAQPAREPATQTSFGTLAIRIQPPDATLRVDGDEWKGSEGAGPLLIELGTGAHEVEVGKQGFTTYRTTVHVRGGETVALNVSLAR
jgi:PEGA domain